MTESSSQKRRRHVPQIGKGTDHIYWSETAPKDEGGKPGKVFEVRDRARRYHVIGTRLDEAKAAARRMYADDAPTPSSAGTTLEKVVENWRQARELRPRTVESYDGILDRHVLPQLGKRKVRELDAGAIRVWLAGLERQDGRPGELASGTRRLILSTLELVLQHAVEIGALGAVPKIEKKRRPKKGESRRRILSREEEASLLWASPAWLRPIVTVAMREALRLGEVLGLEWSDVDFAAGKLHVRRGLSRDGSFGPCKGQTREDFEHGKGPGSSSPRELARRCSSSAARATGPASCSATATAARGGTGTSRVPSRRLAIAPA